MTKKKKVDKRSLLRILIPSLVVGAIAAGIFLLARYVPPVKEALIMATTKKPETFTELYFEDHISLPKEITLFKENKFIFTIHNLENKDMEYPYEVYMEVNGEKQLLAIDSVLIKNNEYMTIAQTFIISTQIQRAKIVVNLIDKNQQIHFWMDKD